MTQPTPIPGPGDPRPEPPYAAFGGEEFFTRLVASFYARVEHDPILKPMYPADQMPAAERRLRLFLMQYWGGPGTYSEERGHPMLRARHMDFTIDAAARDRWLSLMHDAMVEQDLPDELESQLWMYLIQAAFAMQNVDDAPGGAPVNGGNR